MSEIDIAAFKPKSDFVRVLQERGYIHQATDIEGLDKAACEGVITAYIGFDATAASLHVGSLIQIMMLRRLQQTGHRPLPLMGGGTTKVGDPSDKDEPTPDAQRQPTSRRTSPASRPCSRSSCASARALPTR